MKKNIVYVLGGFLFAIFLVAQAGAHTPMLSCWDNGDGTVTCEGGFSDGSSGAGIKMYVVEPDEYKGDGKDKEFYEGKPILQKGKMNKDGEFSFKKPSGSYKVFFDAGPGHVVEVKGEDITE
jgi:hypothetical protein